MKVLQQLKVARSATERQNVIDEASSSQSMRILDGIALAGLDISGLNLSKLQISRVDFRHTICRTVSFPSLEDCIFEGVDACDSTFVRIERCNFRSARLFAARLKGQIVDCDFSEANISCGWFASMGEIQDWTSGNRFDGADLQGLDAAGAAFEGTSFVDAKLTSARLSRANLSRCELNRVDFSRCNLMDCILTGAKMEDANFEQSYMTAEQERILKNLHPINTTNVIVRAHVDGPKTDTLVQALSSIGKFQLEWSFGSVLNTRPEKIMLTNRLTSGELCGYAFDAKSSDFLRIYTLQKHNSLKQILRAISADYVNWVVDSKSVKVLTDSNDASDRFASMALGMFDELFMPT